MLLAEPHNPCGPADNLVCEMRSTTLADKQQHVYVCMYVCALEQCGQTLTQQCTLSRI